MGLIRVNLLLSALIRVPHFFLPHSAFTKNLEPLVANGDQRLFLVVSDGSRFLQEGQRRFLLGTC